jgi:transcriptional antiterminator RfaH
MTLLAGPRWYVVQTQPSAERKADAHLVRQGFSTYLPRYQKRRRHARKVDLVPAALFPRYMFVSIDVTTQRWLAIRSTVGVTQVVCNGNEPAVVPVGVVEQLKASEGADGFIPLDTRPHFNPGDKIKVMDGAFTDCMGLIDSATDRERVAILLDLLGRKVRVVLDADFIAAA